MTPNRFYLFTVVIFILILGFFSFQIIRPFLQPLAWAMVFSIVFYPVFAAVRRTVKYKSLASLITLALIMLVILGPVSYVAFLLVSELREFSGYIESGQLDSLSDVIKHPSVVWLVDWIGASFNIGPDQMQALFVEGVSKLGSQLIERITTGLGNIVSVFLNMIFMAMAIFFLLRDGPDFIRRVRNYVPFSDESKDHLEKQVKGMVVSTIFGGVVVAGIQGLMGGVSFYLLGIPSPAIWGTAMFITSFVPLLGAFAIWGPAMVYLFIIGAVGKGLIMFLIGTFGISLVDNILKPIIIGGRTKMPTLLIFFSVLGGIKLFGIIGLIMGPLALALFISFVEIFRNLEGGTNA